VGVTVQEMMDALESEGIHTWFDLGLFIDRLKENRSVPAIEFSPSFEDFCQVIADGGVAFVTFEFGVDKALQAEGCVRAFEKILGNAPVHYIAGAFQPLAAKPGARRLSRNVSARDDVACSASECAQCGSGLACPSVPSYEVEEIRGFDKWSLYDGFFKTRLERGSEEYNELIGEFWDEVLTVTRKLGEYVEANDIRLLYLMDVCAHPGNVSLSLALVFISEYLGIPVVNHSHDFYWEREGREGETVFTNADVGEFFSQLEVLFPWESRSWINVNADPDQSRYLVEIKGQNPANVAQMPPVADPEAIEKGIAGILYRLYLQLQPDDPDSEWVKGVVDEYRAMCGFGNQDLGTLLQTENRHYLPGYGRTGFMLFLKSLIDPSFFRVEEQRVRGMIMCFAQGLVADNADRASLNVETLHRFYNAVDNLFRYKTGQVKIRHDHSFAYRHRNMHHYPYRDFTHQELTGLVNMLFDRTVPCSETPTLDDERGFQADWEAALAELAGGVHLAIDDREFLFTRAQRNVPVAYFPGEWGRDALEYLVLRPIRMRLKLDGGQTVDAAHLENGGGSIAPVYVFCLEKPCRKRTTFASLMAYVASGDDPELSLLFAYSVCRVVKTDQWCVGIHFPQLGAQALKILREIQQRNGYIVTDDPDAAMMTDIVGIDRFHVGKVSCELASRIMGIPIGGGYVQFVPAGIRTTLAYPTPIQTARDFSDVIHGPRYARLCEKYGEAEVLRRVRRDAASRGSPVSAALASIESTGTAAKKVPVAHSYLCGLYKDNQPWSGVVAKANISQASKRWRFCIATGAGKTREVTAFVRDLRVRLGRMPAIAWNGGFILNAELVGKLGLSESFIGSPLGLIISDGHVLCPPLFNKTAFLVYPDGRLDIKRVNCAQGLFISDTRHCFELKSTNYNPQEPIPDEICFYDLMYEEEMIRGDGRVVLRLAGNVVKDVVHTAHGRDVPLMPVGLTISFPRSVFPDDWDRTGKALSVAMQGWDEIAHAIEAGPMLIDAGKNCIDMEVEGWTARNSIRTQAARTDYTNMRGPKIAIGLDERGDLSVLAINGRIRESVGATHADMAEILIGQGVKKAMGFDPGGSSTLVVGGKTLNISPYNPDYESDIYALPPEPRAVANAVIGWRE